jgi:hypothetical protein
MNRLMMSRELPYNSWKNEISSLIHIPIINPMRPAAYAKLPGSDKGKQSLERCRNKAKELTQIQLLTKKNRYDDFWEKHYLDTRFELDIITTGIAENMILKSSSAFFSPRKKLQEDPERQIFLYVLEHGYRNEPPLLDQIREEYPEPEFTVSIVSKPQPGMRIEWKTDDQNSQKHSEKSGGKWWKKCCCVD